MAWLSAQQALAVLEVRPQTLYANVSRGRIRTKPDPKDPRRSLYNGEDVKRLASRRAGRRAAASVAAEAIRWGDPVLPSGVSTIAAGRLWYRGEDAVRLAQRATLEETAGLLWQRDAIRIDAGAIKLIAPGPATPLQQALAALAERAGKDPPSRGRARTVLASEAEGLMATLAGALLPAGARRCDLPLHQRLSRAWGAASAEDVLRCALVLLADHELNASTFAVRVAISTGASLSAGLLAGLVTLTGPLHGGAAAGVQLLVAAARRLGAREAVREWLAQGQPLPAFGHPLYPDGDPRAQALFAQFRISEMFEDVRAAVEEMTGEKPNVDFALAALADAHDLPAAAPFVIFALARSVGWLAHAFEQIATGELIRPRAHYTGPPLALAT